MLKEGALMEAEMYGRNERGFSSGGNIFAGNFERRERALYGGFFVDCDLMRIEIPSKTETHLV